MKYEIKIIVCLVIPQPSIYLLEAWNYASSPQHLGQHECVGGNMEWDRGQQKLLTTNFKEKAKLSKSNSHFGKWPFVTLEGFLFLQHIIKNPHCALIGYKALVKEGSTRAKTTSLTWRRKSGRQWHPNTFMIPMKSLTQAKTICQVYAKNKFHSQAKFFCAYKECYKKNDLFSIPGRDFHLQGKKKKNYQNRR